MKTYIAVGSLREFIRTHFHNVQSFTARDVSKALKQAGITPKRGAVTDALYRMEGRDVFRVPSLERPTANVVRYRSEQSVATRVYSFHMEN